MLSFRKEIYGMLDWEGSLHLKNILSVSERVWGKRFSVIKVDIKNAPFALMDMELRIYGKYHVLLAYDRSLLAIFIIQGGEPVYIKNFTNKEILGGFSACKEENLLHNFHILDDVLNALER